MARTSGSGWARSTLILACGDLPYYYLEYIVGLLDVPLFYVHGNHDKVVAPIEPRRARRGRHRELGDEPARADRRAQGAAVGRAGRAAAAISPTGPSSIRRTRCGCSRRAWPEAAGEPAALRALPGHPDHACAAAWHPRRRGSAAPGVRELLELSCAVPAGADDPRSPARVQPQSDDRDRVYEGTRIINTYGYRVIELAQDAGRWQFVSGSR